MKLGTGDELIGLVGCGKSKQAHAAPARDLYTGALFRKSLAYAEARCSVVYVLSAKHGLLALDQVVEPYDLTLSSQRCSERVTWARGVWSQLCELYDLRGAAGPRSFMVLAGDPYSAPLLSVAVVLNLLVELLVPLRGMDIGERLQFLTGEPWRPRLRLERDEQGEPVRFVGGARRGPRAAASNHEVDDIQAAAMLRELGEGA
jgi:hypothetical protein